jgi:hypothetical protein
MLSFANKFFMMCVVMLNVVMLSVVMLNVVMLSVVMLNVVAPRQGKWSADVYTRSAAATIASFGNQK